MKRIPVHAIDPAAGVDGEGIVIAGGKFTVGAVGGGSGVQSVVAGTGIAVDSTDPANPVVSATGSGGGGTAGVGAELYYASTTQQTMTTSTRTVDFDSAGQVDTGFTADLAANTITVTDAGWYAISGHVRLHANILNANHLAFVVRADGSNALRGSFQTTAAASEIGCDGISYLTAGTVLKLNYFCSASVAVIGSSDTSATHLRVVKL